jgi:hypothetical protein
LRPLGPQHPPRRGRDPLPHPAEAAAHRRSEEDRALRQLQEATGADEFVITTITPEHADRVRSSELLAQEWFRD